ncbi:MAG: hypothetical protein ABIR71_06330 [Chthoniobacterales bacterium]
MIHQLAPAYGNDREALYDRLEALGAFPPVGDAWSVTAKPCDNKPADVSAQNASEKLKKRDTADIRASRVNVITADISRDLRKARARSFDGR